jgi:hypothetical protein
MTLFASLKFALHVSDSARDSRSQVSFGREGFFFEKSLFGEVMAEVMAR